MPTKTTAAITTPYAPDLEQVRAWLLEMIKTLRFVELVTAIVALVARLRDLNAELVRRLAHLQRKRPRSETLERLERQLLLPLAGTAVVVKAPPKKTGDDDKPKGRRKGKRPRAIAGAPRARR